MSEISENDHYVFEDGFNGGLIVVEDLALSEAAYALEIDEESDERYEFRQKAITLGRGGNKEEVISILSNETYLESDEIEIDI